MRSACALSIRCSARALAFEAPLPADFAALLAALLRADAARRGAR